MKCTLINAVRFEETSQRAIPTLGLFYLQAYAARYAPGIEVKVARTPLEVIHSKPDVIGMTAVTENFSVALQWARNFREKLGVPIIVGGDHISALPHILPADFDLGVVGEGEETFVELARLMEGDPQWRKKLADLPGICFHGGEGVVVNERRPLIMPLDRVPHPARPKDIWGGFHYCFTSRGCPYNCTFCSPNVIWKNYRSFSAGYVMEELEEMFRDFNPYYVHFFDDLFIGDRKRVGEISRLVQKKGLNKRAVFGGHIRADMMDDEMCRNLKGMNFISGAFGAESGSDKILKFLKTGSTDVAMNQKAIEICNRHGIQLNLSFIIGTPGETEEDIKMTIDFIDKNRGKINGIEIFIVMPYPGTPLWTLCKRKGQVSEDMNWDLFRTKAFFSEMEITENFLYINDAMDRDTFRNYVDIFKKIDKDFNKGNLNIFETIEKSVPSPVKTGPKAH